MENARGPAGQRPVRAELLVLAARRAVEADPDKHRGDLALALFGLGNQMTEVGRHAGSLAAFEEACALSRLAGDPGLLVRTLTGLGIRLAAAGRLDEAVTAVREAVEIQRGEPGGEPGTFSPHLASALWGYALVCARAGAADDQVLAAADEAVTIYESARRRHRRGFDEFWGNQLRAAYSARADVLDALGRAKEAAKLRRKLNLR